MYQVSMFVSNARKLGSWGNGGNWIKRGVGPAYDLVGCGAYEIIFGWNSHLQDYPPSLGTCAPNGPYELPQLPQGPIYWDYNRPDQLDPLQGGERIVGQQNRGTTLSNNQVVSADVYHYWPDLKQIALHQSIFDGPFGEPAGTYGVMWLKPGYNTFYMEGAPYRNIPTRASRNQGWPNHPEVINNAGGYGGYIGGIDSNRVGPDRANNNMRFFAETGPLEFDGNSDNSLPRKGYLYCGNPAVGASPLRGKEPWDYAASELYRSGLQSEFSTTTVVEGTPAPFTNIIVGNTVPNGRYVVTLRATDRNGSGLYFEWDLPIVIKGTTPMSESSTYTMYPSIGKNC
jgi:hypothetical protein